MKSFIVIASISLSGCSMLEPRYMVNLHSQLSDQREMTVRFDGDLVCSSRVSKGAHVGCGPISSLPKQATIAWAVPYDWKTTEKDRHQAEAALRENAPAWFTTGDAVVFTISEEQTLKVSFECHRMNVSCAGVAPVKIPSPSQRTAE